MTIAYTAIEIFDPSTSEAWAKYIEWSGLDHLKEVISLDSMLCPSLIEGLTAEDWDHKVYEDIFHDLFRDLSYLLRRIRPRGRYQIVATIREPSREAITDFSDERFGFKGYDLLEDQTRVSALTNCGGFDLAFSKADISDCGLLWEHEKAYDVRDALLRHYPEESHADCAVWALWRLNSHHLYATDHD
jgi:hypothetical protein